MIWQPWEEEVIKILEEFVLLLQQKNNASNPQLVVQQVLCWTKGQPTLTQKLCQLILIDESPISAGSESQWVENLVRSWMIKNWKTQLHAEHLRKISDLLLEDKQSAFQRLQIYQNILQHKEVVFDESLAQEDLCRIGLIVDKKGHLRVHNRIYETVFNQSWVRKNLSKLPPYSKSLAAWKNSHDNFQLLRGKTLQEALAWAEGKSLTSEEKDFLNASKKIDKQTVQISLDGLSAEAIQNAEILLSKARNSSALIKAILSWTGGEPILTQQVSQLVLIAESLIPEGSEELAIEKLVRSRIIENWETQVAGEHLNKICRNLLHNTNCEPLRLLKLYQHISHSQKVAVDNSREQRELLQLGLLIDKEGHLTVHNRIYASVFDDNWVEKVLTLLPETPLTPGTLIANQYRIEKVIGQGGFGRTYLASNIRLGNEPFVLKEFMPDNTDEFTAQKSRQLFHREAQLLLKLDHFQIPKFLDFIEDNSKLFIVQKYIDGKTYTNLLIERQKAGKTFSEREVIKWLKELLPVLDYIHSLGIIHRDISPDNIMLPHNQYRPILIDFGSANQKLTNLTNSNSDVSSNIEEVTLVDKHSYAVGKNGYAAPEQANEGECFPSSDIYSLGVTAVVLLTGKNPDLLLDMESLEWRWRSYVRINNRLDQIIDKMIAKEQKYRYQSAKEVLNNLQRVITQAATWKCLNNFSSYTKEVVSLAFNPDGDTLASLSYETKRNGSRCATVKIWNVDTGKRLTLSDKSLESYYCSVVFSHQGELLASGSKNGQKITIWNLDKGALKWNFYGHLQGVFCFAFTSDGQIMSSASNQGTIQLWDLETGEKQKTLPGYIKSIAAIAISSNLKTLCFVNLENKITKWDLDTGQQYPVNLSNNSNKGLGSLINKLFTNQPKIKINPIAISPNGETLASCSDDHKITLWNIRTSTIKLLDSLSGHDSEITAIAFSQDGQTIASSSKDGKIIIFRQS